MEKASGLDPKRVVVVFFALAAIALGTFLEKAVAIVFSYTRWNDSPVLGEDWTLSTVIGYGVALAAAVIAWRTPRVHEVSTEVALELKRVTWPSRRETWAATVAVLVATFVAAALLGAFDFVWGWLSGLVY